MSDRPQEVRKPLVLANFRPLFKTERPRREPWRLRREGMSEMHLARIRQLRCTIPGCMRTDIEAHHLKAGPARRERGLYLKATDRWAVPLCGFLHHNELEGLGSRAEPAYFDDVGIEAYHLAVAYWNKSYRCKDDERALDDMRAIQELYHRQAPLILWQRAQKVRRP
jgi:hypothetical protein